MPRRKKEKKPPKRKVEQYEYVKVYGDKKTKTKKTKKPKGSGDVVQTVIVQTGKSRPRRAAKKKEEVWMPMSAPAIQQVVQPALIPYQFQAQTPAPIIPVAKPATKEMETQTAAIEPTFVFEPTIVQDVGTQTKPKAKAMETQTAAIEPTFAFEPTIVQDMGTQTKKNKNLQFEDITESQRVPASITFDIPQPNNMRVRKTQMPETESLVETQQMPVYIPMQFAATPAVEQPTFGISLTDTLESLTPISASPEPPSLLSLSMPSETTRTPAEIRSPPIEAPEIEPMESATTPPPSARRSRPSYLRKQRPTIGALVSHVMNVEGLSREEAAQLIAQKRDYYKGQYTSTLTTNTKNEKSLLDVARDYDLY